MKKSILNKYNDILKDNDKNYNKYVNKFKNNDDLINNADDSNNVNNTNNNHNYNKNLNNSQIKTKSNDNNRSNKSLSYINVKKSNNHNNYSSIINNNNNNHNNSEFMNSFLNSNNNKTSSIIYKDNYYDIINNYNNNNNNNNNDNLNNSKNTISYDFPVYTKTLPDNLHSKNNSSNFNTNNKNYLNNSTNNNNNNNNIYYNNTSMSNNITNANNQSLSNSIFLDTNQIIKQEEFKQNELENLKQSNITNNNKQAELYLENIKLKEKITLLESTISKQNDFIENLKSVNDKNKLYISNLEQDYTKFDKVNNDLQKIKTEESLNNKFKYLENKLSKLESFKEKIISKSKQKEYVNKNLIDNLNEINNLLVNIQNNPDEVNLFEKFVIKKDINFQESLQIKNLKDLLIKFNSSIINFNKLNDFVNSEYSYLLEVRDFEINELKKENELIRNDKIRVEKENDLLIGKSSTGVYSKLK